VFCAAHSCRSLIVTGGSKELRGMDRRAVDPLVVVFDRIRGSRTRPGMLLMICEPVGAA
jgi:hypothetical protein